MISGLRQPYWSTARTVETMLKFGYYKVCELRYTLFSIYFRLVAAIFEFQHTQILNSIPTSLSVLPDPELLFVAVVISLLSCVSAEICVTELV